MTVFALVFSAIMPCKSFAWSKEGHRVIAEIASSLLRDETRGRIESLLGGASIAMAANWGDFVKSDPAYAEFYDWHFTNFADGLTRQQFDVAALASNDGQCIYRVVELSKELKENPGDVEKLKMLIHIAGDMFQPLHLGRRADLGGNKIQLRWFNRGSNLHELWDSSLIESEDLSYTEYAAYINSFYKPQKEDFSKQLVLDAAWASYQLLPAIYASADTANKSYEYIYRFEPVWERQLAAGGVFLAAALNYIYGVAVP